MIRVIFRGHKESPRNHPGYSKISSNFKGASASFPNLTSRKFHFETSLVMSLGFIQENQRVFNQNK